MNDLEGCTYMSQSLPFGGRNKSGYDRFAGPEGLRGLCMVRSVCEGKSGLDQVAEYICGSTEMSGLIICIASYYLPDRADLIHGVTMPLPPPMHYPATGVGAKFATGLIWLFYSTSVGGHFLGIAIILQNFIAFATGAAKKGKASDKSVEIN